MQDDSSGKVGQPTRSEAEVSSTSRRQLLASGAATVAAVAAVAGLTSKKAYAANGDNFLVGLTNTGTAQTKLDGGSTLWVQDGATTGGASVYGSQGASAGSYGVHGAHSGTVGVGVYGDASGSSGIGVYGRATGTAGPGVRGESELGPGLVGSGLDYDVQADGSGRLGLTQAGQAGSAADTGAAGTLARDESANLWYCTTSGSPGSWRKLAGPNTLGSLQLLSEPESAYDSRLETGGEGRLEKNEVRVVSLANVPEGATALLLNVTLLKPKGSGSLGITAGDVTAAPPPFLWFKKKQTTANSTVVQPSTGDSVRLHSAGGKMDVTIDLLGYWL